MKTANTLIDKETVQEAFNRLQEKGKANLLLTRIGSDTTYDVTLIPDSVKEHIPPHVWRFQGKTITGVDTRTRRPFINNTHVRGEVSFETGRCKLLFAK